MSKLIKPKSSTLSPELEEGDKSIKLNTAVLSQSSVIKLPELISQYIDLKKDIIQMQRNDEDSTLILEQKYEARRRIQDIYGNLDKIWKFNGQRDTFVSKSITAIRDVLQVEDLNNMGGLDDSDYSRHGNNMNDDYDGKQLRHIQTVARYLINRLSNKNNIEVDDSEGNPNRSGEIDLVIQQREIQHRREAVQR